MATSPKTPLPISTSAQERVIKYLTGPVKDYSKYSTLRAHLLQQDREYCRELDWTARHLEARRKNLSGDPQAVQNIIVPVNEPLVESTLSYLTELYLSGEPLFPVITPPELEPIGTQIEALVAESSIQFQYPLHLQRALRDGLKHNLLAVDCTWKRRVVGASYPSAAANPAKSQERLMWEGQELKHVSLYNAFFDTRVMPSEVSSKGDFAGYSELMSYVQLKQLFADLEPTNTMNAVEAFKSKLDTSSTGDESFNSFYIPELNPDFKVSVAVQTNWLQWVGLENTARQDYSDAFDVMKLYVRLIPSDFGIPSQGPNHPQLWLFYIVNKKVVIYAKRIQSADDSFPLVLGQLIDDGHGWQTKSFQDGASSYQSIASALYNSGLVSQRRKVYDRLFYDPSRIRKQDIDRVDPVARIAVKTEAYGTQLSEAVWAQPYRDDGVAQIFATGREVIEMGDIATGSNRVQRGQFQRGNKTRFEFQETMGNSNARPRLMATVLESSFFQPLKYKIKIGILDNQKAIKFLDRSSGQEVSVTPTELRTKLWQFKLGDGMLPADKLVNMDALQLVVQLASAQPAFAVEYDVVGMASYVMSMQGAKWVSTFKRTEQQQQSLIANMQATNAKPGPEGTGNPPAGANA